MLATSIWDDAAAWLGLPVAYAVTGLGVGLLLERAAAVRLPSAALLPLGMSGSICALLAVYKLGGHGLLPVALLIALSGAGFVLARRELLDRLRPGAAGAAALGVLALYLAPTLLSGHWSWNGYNFLNDTAVQLLLADLLQHHGVGLVQGDFSTRSESIRIYLESAYPLGTHAHLAALSTLLGVGVDVAYQSYIAMLAATAAVALAALARRSGLSPWRAALAGTAALAASLIYHYGMQGSIKELSAFACLATAAMLGRELLAADRPVRGAVLLGVAASGAINVFSAAAGPYLVALALALLGAVLLQARPLVGRLPAIAAAGALTVAVAALPTLTSAFTFAGAANDALSAGSTLASTLGQLTRPLEPIQVAGVWLAEDYAMPIGQPSAEALTTGLSILVLVLAVIAVVLFLRRRESGPLLIALATVAAAVAVAPRASPYADAKLLALASPAVVFAAMCGALAWRGRFGIPGAAAAAVAAVAVLTSSAYATRVPW